MENEKLNEELKKIQDLVAGLQDPVKTIAAQELVAKLLGTKQVSVSAESEHIKPIIKPSKKSTLKSVSNKSSSIKEDEERDKQMIQSIDRTQYPEIHNFKKSLDRALYTLMIMKEKGHDGLNPSQINLILNEVFGVISNAPAVSMALIKDKFYTKKVPMAYKGAKAYRYKIIQTGVDYIGKTMKELKKLDKRSDVHKNQEESAQQS